MKRTLFIVLGSIPVVLAVYVGQVFIGVVLALLVMACCLFVPALQSPKAEPAPVPTATAKEPAGRIRL